MQDHKKALMQTGAFQQKGFCQALQLLPDYNYSAE